MNVVIVKLNQGNLKMDNNENKVSETDEILDIYITESTSTKSENEEKREKVRNRLQLGEKDGNTDEKESRLNPDSNVITKKDPDEIIMLPNDELKRWNNRNRNQPL
jgi:hypothetical protein